MKNHPVIAGCAVIVIIFLLGFIAIAVLLGPGGGSAFLKDNNVAIVDVKGIILESREIVRELEDYGKDESVKAIVLRIDSPGGSVAPSQEIYETVKKLDADKPVIASMGSVAASGGYYIALGARKVLTNPGTITGSIGVIIEISNVEGLMEWANIRQEVIKSGPYKDIGSPFRPLSDNERDKLQKLTNDIFGQFVEAVVQSRGMSEQKVLEIANGMIYSGREALDLGLVDNIGTLTDAVEMAAKEAGIEGEPGVIYPSSPTFWEKLLESKINVINEVIPKGGIRAMYLLRI